MAMQDPRLHIGSEALDELRAVAAMLTRCADQAYSAFPRGQVAFEHKTDRSRVTRLDLDLERNWRETIHRHFPEHSVVGEELGAASGDSEFCWYLDPVDGTDDLTRGIPLYGYIVALYYRGLPIVGRVGHPALALSVAADIRQGTWVNGWRVPRFQDRRSSDPAVGFPAMEDFLRAGDESGLYLKLSRRFPNYRTYRTVYAHTAVLTGALDAAIEFDVAEWDIAATRLLMEEAGGVFMEFRRQDAPGGTTRLGAVFGAPATVGNIHDLILDHS